MNLNLSHASRIALNLLGLLGGSIALYLGAYIFIPLVFSVLLASVLYPFARALHEKLLIPWFFACLGAVMALVVLHLIVIVAFSYAIPKTIKELPQTEAEWAKQYNKVQNNLSQMVPIREDDQFLGVYDPASPEPPPKAIALVKKQLTEENLSKLLGLILLESLSQLFTAILILFITFFLLIEGQMLADKIKAIFGPSQETQGRVAAALAEMAVAVRTYLIWRTVVNLGLALVLGLVYWGLELKYWYLWALLVAVLSYVPYIGTIAAGIPPILDALLFVDPLTSFVIMTIYVSVVTVEGYFIVPWVMGRSMDLNATTVLISCLYWHQIWGIAGLFLAMPLMAAVKAICMQAYGWQGWGHLMGSGPAVPIDVDLDAAEERIESRPAVMPEGDGERTTVMDSLDGKGGARPGDSKRGY
jgi:AI-2 transport protein TqsA